MWTKPRNDPRFSPSIDAKTIPPQTTSGNTPLGLAILKPRKIMPSFRGKRTGFGDALVLATTSVRSVGWLRGSAS